MACSIVYSITSCGHRCCLYSVVINVCERSHVLVMLNDCRWLVGIWALQYEVLILSAFIIIHRGRVSIYFIFLVIITAYQYYQNISRAVSPLVYFQASLQNCQKRLSASSCLFVCPSVRLYAWNNSVPTWWIFIKFDIRVFGKFSSNKFGKIDGYFIHENQYAFFHHIPLNYSYHEKYSTQQLQRQSKHILFSLSFFRKWLHERASFVRHTYSTLFVFLYFIFSISTKQLDVFQNKRTRDWEMCWLWWAVISSSNILIVMGCY